MRILLLSGSPKGESSDTLHITRAFLRGIDEVSASSVKYIDATRAHIEYCRGCLTCMRNGGKCVIDDDMTGILADIIESDLLVFSFPLYVYGIPAPLKALLDRTVALSSIKMEKSGDRYAHSANADCSHLRCVMISGCGFPNAKHNFEALRLQFQMAFRGDLYMLTVPEAPMFNAPQAEPVTKPYLELVARAGREYAENGSVSAELEEKLSVPMIPEEAYAAICNGGQ